MTQTSKQRPLTPRQAARRSRPIDSLLNTALFKALADPTRAALLACLAKCGRACSVGELAECCSVDMSVVSRHLALLGRAGLITPVKSGRTVTYTVRYAEVSLALRNLAAAFDDCCPNACGTGDACGTGQGCGCGGGSGCGCSGASGGGKGARRGS